MAKQKFHTFNIRGLFGVLPAIIFIFAAAVAFGQNPYENANPCCLGTAFFCAWAVYPLPWVAPLIPDYHLLVQPGTGVFHGMGWKLPIGVTFFDAEYQFFPGFYILSPLLNFAEQEVEIEGFNSLRLEIIGEIMLTTSNPGFMYGAACRIYIPVNVYFSFHAEAGILTAPDTGTSTGIASIPHYGGGVGIYLGDNHSSSDYDNRPLVFSILLNDRVLVLDGNRLMNDLEIDIKFRVFY